MRAGIKQTLIAGGSFAGGILTGYLLSRQHEARMRNYFKRFTSDGSSNEPGKEILEKEKNSHVETLNKNFKRAIGVPVPDLFQATEKMKLDENDVRILYGRQSD